MHGASAPQVRRAAAARVERAQAERIVRSLGLRDDRDPDAAILDEFAWTLGHIQWLRDRVQDLNPEALVWGTTSEVDKQASEYSGIDRTSEAAPSIWYELYTRERRHLAELYKAIKRAGIEERQLELARTQVAPQVAEVISRFVAEIGLTDEQAARVPEVLRRAVSGFLAGGPRVLEGSVQSG